MTILGKITNLEILHKIISGEIRGLSVGMRIRKWECSICHKDYETCPHEKGKLYGGVKCYPIAKEIEFTEISLVKFPADPRCKVTDLLIIKIECGKKIYEWYGFEAPSKKIHLKNIRWALQSRLIPNEVANHFSKFFSINSEGKVVYP